MKYCQFCGENLTDDSNFCSKCGRRLDGKGALSSFGSSLTSALDRATETLDSAARRFANFLTSEEYDAPNYLLWSILATIFGCLPVGCVAIYYSSLVNSRKAKGDLNGAISASKSAKLWLVAAILIGLVLGPALFLRFHVGGAVD